MSLSEISWLNAALSQGDVALPSKMRFPAWTIRTIVVHPFAGPAIHRTKTRSFPSDSNGPSVQRGMTKFARHTQHQAFIRGWRCTGGRSHGPTHGAPQAGDQLPPPAPRGRGWSGGFGRVSGQSGVPRGGGGGGLQGSGGFWGGVGVIRVPNSCCDGGIGRVLGLRRTSGSVLVLL